MDNHTALGQSGLAQTLTTLVTSALHGSAVPDPAFTAPLFELLRVSANLCMDHGK